jgi:predicted methyltransferase
MPGAARALFRVFLLSLSLTAAALGGAVSTAPPAVRAAASERLEQSSRLDRERGREAWQKVDEIFAALGVAEGGRVADVGAGGGFFTVRLARAVGPGGRVYAVDINASVVRDLEDRVHREGLDNVEVILGETTDPSLPEGLDGVLIVNAYHEMTEHQAMLQGIARALRPGGRLVIVEPIAPGRAAAPRERQAARHEIASRYVLEDLRQAGFEIVDRRDPFVERPDDRDIEWLIVATPPPRHHP